MESIKASAEQMVYNADNATASMDSMSPIPSGFSLYQPRVTIGFALILLIVVARIFGAGKPKLPAGVKPLPRQFGLPYAGRFWDVPGPGIEAAWHFGDLHKTMGPIYEWKVSTIIKRHRLLQWY